MEVEVSEARKKNYKPSPGNWPYSVREKNMITYEKRTYVSGALIPGEQVKNHLRQSLLRAPFLTGPLYDHVAFSENWGRDHDFPVDIR